MLKPYHFQGQSIDFVKSRQSSIVAHEPGLGKTMIAISAAEPPCLVVCPASVQINWRREIGLWAPDADPKDFEIMSYAHPDWFLVRPEKWRTMIVDEVHYIKNPGAKRSQMVGALVRRIGRRGRVIALSGTLVPNRPIELWPLLYAMRITGMSYEDFAYRYAAAYEDEWGELNVRGASRLPELRRLIEPHTIRFTKAQVLTELPDKTYRVVALNLPPGAAEKEFSRRDLQRMDELPAMEVMSTVLREQGIRKVPLALSHIEDALESTGKVLVFAHHREVIDLLNQGLRKHGIRSGIVRGGMTRAQKQRVIDRFQNVGSCRVFLGEITAAGVGINLTAASYVIFVEASWVPADIEQAADRAHRMGQKDHVLVDLLTIDGSIDEHMLRRAVEKMAIVDQIVPTSRLRSEKGK